MRNGRKDGPFEITIDSDLQKVFFVQEEISHQLRSCHFEDREIFGIRLALEEALINAIKHGNRLHPDKKVRIELYVLHDRVDIAIADEGAGFNPEQVADPLVDENLDRPSGRGLFLIRHYMSELIYHPPGNRLTMSKVRVNGNGSGNGGNGHDA